MDVALDVVRERQPVPRSCLEHVVTLKGEERWGSQRCGSGGRVLDVELGQESTGTKELLLSLVLGGGIAPPVTERTFAALRCPPTIPIFYGEFSVRVIMGNYTFPYIMGNTLPLLQVRTYSWNHRITER